MNEVRSYKHDAIMKVVNETLESFDEIRERHDKKIPINWDYEIGRDRKAAIVIKGVLAAVHVDQSENRRNWIDFNARKLDSKSKAKISADE